MNVCVIDPHSNKKNMESSNTTSFSHPSICLNMALPVKSSGRFVKVINS